MLLNWKRARLLAGVVFSLLYLGACSHTVSRSSLPDDLPLQVELYDTPFYAQERYQCGPASLAMVLNKSGVAVQPEALVDRVYLPERQGSVATEMVATARSHGRLVYELTPSMDALLREVAAGNPVLVLQNLGLSWLPKWHYAVVVGYDLTTEQIILNSGVTERLQVPLSLFDRTWRRAKRWGITVLEPGMLPAGNDHFRYMSAAFALEQTRQDDKAIAAYRSASKRWPGESTVWLAWANLSYKRGFLADAEKALRSGLEYLPDNPQLWNNLAYVLAEKACYVGALRAVGCARRLSPVELNYRQSEEEITGMNTGAGAVCAPVNCPVPLLER